MVTPEEIAAAVAALRAGQLVGMPTETVYGLAGDAASEHAVRRIFAAKGRPADHPVIVHVADASGLDVWGAEVPAAAYALAERFWPGPLTMIVPRAPRVLNVVTGGQPSVGLRVPKHPVAQALLRAFGGGLAAPSANRFGRISPTRAEHVHAELGDSVAMVLDGGPTDVGLESTIVDLTGAEPLILRPGHITAADLGAVLGAPPRMPEAATTRAPGTLASHYAPRTPVELVDSRALHAVVAARAAAGPVAVLARRPAPAAVPGVQWRQLPGDAQSYGRELYAALRELDAAAGDLIVVESVPLDSAWLAVRDRLRRAAHRESGGEN